MTDYIPTTEQVREEFIDSQHSSWCIRCKGNVDIHAAEFDRWLERHDSKIREMEHDRFLASLKNDLKCHCDEIPMGAGYDCYKHEAIKLIEPIKGIGEK